MSQAKLIDLGNKCLDQRIEVPSAPLWHMGKVAVFDSEKSYLLLQNTIDYLTCKGKQGLSFTSDEKEFLIELFEALWWGGKYKDYDEAAKLANHYVNGDGEAIIINSQVYKESVIVKATIEAMKEYIVDLDSKSEPIAFISSKDKRFTLSQFAQHLLRGRRDPETKGYLYSYGALLTEQVNKRLKNADHRFYLNVKTFKDKDGYHSTWKVDSVYDFEPFSKGDVTHLPLNEQYVIKLPDGLSHYMTVIGIAKAFRHTSSWQEVWK